MPQGYALPPYLDKGWAPGRPSGPSSLAQLSGGEAVKWNLPLEEALGFLLPRLGREMRPVVGAVFPFAEAEAAFQALLERGHTGKTMVRF